MKSSNKGFFYALIAVFFFSTFGVSSKLLTNNIDGFSLTFWMILASTLFLLVYVIIKKKFMLMVGELKNNYWFFILMGLLGFCFHQIVYVKAYELSSATSVVAIFYSYPLMMILFSRLFLKEKTTWVSAGFVTLGFLGLFYAMTGGDVSSFSFSVGTLFVILAMLSWALFSVLLKLRNVDADVGMFLFNLFGFLGLLVMLPFLSLDYTFSIKEVGGIVYVAVFTAGVAMILWDKALHLTKVSVCSNTALLTPVLSLVWIFLILEEKLVFSQFVGFAIIMASVFLNFRFSKKDD